MRKINIPIFVPHLGCQHDCVFCNQHRITGAQQQIDAERAQKLMEAAIKTLPAQGAAQVEIAFFGGSFTAIEQGLQESLLAAAQKYVKHGVVDGIRVSTRPDCVDEAVLKRLARYGVTAVELGVQSTDDKVLWRSGRGHAAIDSFQAAERVREAGFELGLQMMLGLPESTWEAECRTAEDIAAMHPASVRIYPTLVLKDSPLYEMMLAGSYEPLSLETAVSRCARLYTFFTARGIAVIRMGLMASEEIAPGRGVAAGPFHPAFGELVASYNYLEKIYELLGKYRGEEAVIAVHPREVSKAVGQHRGNLKRIYADTGIKVLIKPDEAVEVGECLWYNKT